MGFPESVTRHLLKDVILDFGVSCAFVVLCRICLKAHGGIYSFQLFATITYYNYSTTGIWISLDLFYQTVKQTHPTVQPKVKEPSMDSAWIRLLLDGL